jgi:molybdopterin synthase catalytic subunit
MTALRIRVRLFARQRELAGTREVALRVPAPAIVEDAWTALALAVPAIADGRPYVRFAVNGAYAEPSARLADGDELAIVPPVSGGAGERQEARRQPAPGGRWILGLRPAPLATSLGRELAERLATAADGATVVFEGRTRVTPGAPAPGEEAAAAAIAGLPVEALEYEALDPLVDRVLGEIADETGARFGVTRLAVVHAIGRVPLGEASVVVVTVAPHRAEAFAAAAYLMDEVKARAPIWKAEHAAGGHAWIGAPARTGPADRPA